jgi:hypothetical protein
LDETEKSVRQLCTVLADLPLLRLLAIARARLLWAAPPLLFDAVVSALESALDSALFDGDRLLAGLFDGLLLIARSPLFPALLSVLRLLLLESARLVSSRELPFLRLDGLFRFMPLIIQMDCECWRIIVKGCCEL